MWGKFINLWNKYGKEIFDYYLDNGRVIQDNWINSDWILKNKNKNDLDVRVINKLLGILSLEVWYRIFITKEMNSNSKLIWVFYFLIK